MGNTLRYLGGNHRFAELRFFSITNLSSGSPFEKVTFTRIKFPVTLQIIDFYYNSYLPCTILDIPEGTVGTWLYTNRVANLRVLIVRSATVKYSFTPPSETIVYVPQAGLEEYKAADGWKTAESRIRPIEGSLYETFNEWEWI